MSVKNKSLDTNSQEYTNALLEDINGKFQAVLKATAHIPEMRMDISTIKERLDRMDFALDAFLKKAIYS